MPTVIDVIEDDSAVRDSLKSLLEACGYTVRDYANADVYLTEKLGHADCIITDYRMPGTTGLGLLSQLREKGLRTPTLIVTGGSDFSILSRAYFLGARTLLKPISDELIIETIEAMLTEERR